MCGWLQPPTHDYDPPHLGYYIMFQLYPSKPNTHKGRYYSTWAVTWVTMQILVHTTPSLVFIYPDFHCPTTWYPHGQNPSYRFSIYHPIKTNNRLKKDSLTTEFFHHGFLPTILKYLFLHASYSLNVPCMYTQTTRANFLLFVDLQTQLSLYDNNKRLIIASTASEIIQTHPSDNTNILFPIGVPPTSPTSPLKHPHTNHLASI